MLVRFPCVAGDAGGVSGDVLLSTLDEQLNYTTGEEKVGKVEENVEKWVHGLKFGKIKIQYEKKND